MHPPSHPALGYVAFTGRRTNEAVRHFQAALDLNPNFAAAAGSVGFALALDGQSEEAIRRFEQAMRMSPRDPFNSFFFVGIAAAHYLAGRYTDAINWAQQAVQLRPDTWADIASCARASRRRDTPKRQGRR